jgi:hypothetical protein
MSGGPSAGNDPLFPSTTPPPNQISNRESLRLEMPAIQTKQTTQPHSNREVEALFQAGSGLSIVSAIAKESIQPGEIGSGLMIQPGIMTTYPPFPSHQNAIDSAGNLPTSPKNTTASPSFLFRLKTTPTVYFLRVTESFNRNMLRLRRTSIEPVSRQSGPFCPARKRRGNIAHVSRTSNRDTNLLEMYANT